VFLYREVLHVPLIVKLPQSQRRGETVEQPVQLIDVAPTIAALTGASPRSPFAGTSLLASVPAGREIYSETMLPRIHFGWSELRSLVDAQHHFIEAPGSELYDMVGDPAERTNIAADERRTLADMRDAMAQHASAFTQPVSVDPEEAAKLAALGYLGQTRSTPEGAALPDPKDRIGELEELKAGAELERRGDIAAAIAKYESIVAKNAQFTDAWLRLGAAQDRLGRLQDAVRSYRRAMTIAPLLVQQNALALGSLYLRLGELVEADAHARLVLKSRPGAAHHLLGRIALARGDRRTAQQEARLAMEDASYREPAAVLLATIAIEEGRPADAVRQLDDVKMSARGPVLDLEFTRADALARMERFAESEEAFRKEIAAFPNNRQAYTRLAVLYVTLNRVEDAEKTLQRMFDANRSASTAELAAETWSAVENRSAAAKWRERAAHMR
jgi:tetratricopeptide (TPR) repeat protein